MDCRVFVWFKKNNNKILKMIDKIVSYLVEIQNIIIFYLKFPCLQ